METFNITAECQAEHTHIEWIMVYLSAWITPAYMCDWIIRTLDGLH